MIIGIIFFAHLIFSIIIFTKKWQDEGVSGGLLNIALIGILFSVGWTITGMTSKLLMEPKGFGIYYDRDAFSLSILTILEYFFYKMYYKDLFNQADTEKQ